MENKDKKEKKYPEPIVGAMILDEKGRMFLAKSHKWKGKYTIPGGHVELNENLEMAAMREVKEETNMDIEVIDCMGVDESINHKGFYEERHFIFLEMLCKFKGKENDIELNAEFDGEYIWTEPEKAKELDIADGVKMILDLYFKYKELHRNHDNLKRLGAEFENFKKRQADSRKELLTFANQELIMEILPVVDNFHASTDHIPKDQKDNSWVVGIMHIQKQLEKVLEDNGVSEIVVKAGDGFDPETMEAMADNSKVHAVKSPQSEVAEGEFNRVKKVLIKGYRIGEKVIRAARVIVG